MVMQRINNNTLLLVLSVFCAITVYSQSAKKSFKEGEEKIENGQIQEGIDLFTKAINTDPEYEDAINERGKAYLILNKSKEALVDFNRLISLDPKKSDAYLQSGILYYLDKDYSESIRRFKKVIELDRKNQTAYHKMIDAMVKLELYEEAMTECENLLETKESDENYYKKGTVALCLEKYENANIAFAESIEENDQYTESYYGKALALFHITNYNQAHAVVNEYLNFDQNNKKGLELRSKIHYKTARNSEAIQDLSKIISLYPDDQEIESLYFTRGCYYLDFMQHINAIADFDKVIKLNPDKLDAYYKKAETYESISPEKAVAAYKVLIDKATKVKNNNLISDAKLRLYDLRREDEKPKIAVLLPETNLEGHLEIPRKAVEISVKIEVKDQNEIDFIKINDQVIDIDKGENEHTIDWKIDVDGKDDFNIQSGDVYENEASKAFAFSRVDDDRPEIKLINPYSSDYDECFIETEDPEIMIEGIVEDESPIKTILVEGELANYSPDFINPSFQALVDIANKSKIMVKAVDYYGNETIKNFTLNREGAILAQDNPMGKTWAVFIENSNYKSFASLEGPSRDVKLMRSALSNYKISNILAKKDMTKEEMEKFFSIELRNLIKAHNVNSLLVWYAGHGKFVHDQGFWIPVDAVRDEEFSYFNVNNLKASLQGYSGNLTHTLVVTDACETGPSFYQAMRSEPKKRRCDDKKATKFKSNQVFSSAGYELASDQSQFSKTFANMLIYNSDACMPIEDIVIKVSDVVEQNSKQKPLFGKIAGLEDEDGTFFFIKRD